MFGCWGLLPIAVPGALFVGARLGAVALPNGSGADRALGGVVLFGALTVAVVQGLAAAQLVDRRALLLALTLAAVALGVLVRPRRPAPLGAVVTAATAPLLVAAAVAISVAVLAAYWLPVWQWDALGYHLPYVNFVVRAHSLNAVPTDMPYVSTYPHNVEMLMIALRAMLPDDRLVDLAQIPCGLLGGVATAAIARRCGAPRSLALAS